MQDSGEVKSTGLQSYRLGFQSYILYSYLFTSCVTLGKLLNLSVPQFSHIEKGGNNSSCVTELLLGLNEHIDYSEDCPHDPITY